MTNKLRSIAMWIAAHFDAALLLAAAVEIPRWTVTFLAIHEPLWVGIPLGALLAYATSEGWKAYFTDRNRIMLLTFNVVSLIAAVFVITPVLFSMANAPINEIDLAQIMSPEWLLAWSAVLAVTTFAPLIQLAAVKSAYKSTTPTTTAEESPDVDTLTPHTNSVDAALPATALDGAPTPSSIPAKRKRKARKAAKPTPQQRRAQITPNMDAADVVAKFGVSVRTAQADIAATKSAVMQVNGVHA